MTDTNEDPEPLDELPEVDVSYWPTSDDMDEIMGTLTSELSTLQRMASEHKMSGHRTEEFERRMNVVELLLRVFETSAQSYNARMYRMESATLELSSTVPQQAASEDD